MQNAFATISRKTVASITLGALLLGSFGAALQTARAATTWDTTGSYVMDQEYLTTNNPHNMSLVQDEMGNLTGGGNSGAYTWVIDSGSVSGDTVMFTAHYTATEDATTTVLQVTSVIAPDGTMSGTWSDNYPGPGLAEERTGTWTTTSGAAQPITATVTTLPATNITASDATLNGLNGGTAATQSSFWVSTSTFSTAAPVLPPGVYSTADLGAVPANMTFSAPLTSVLGLPPVTASTTYYYAAWANVNGTWTPGSIETFSTLDNGTGTIGGEVEGGTGALAVTSVTAVDTSGSADNTYENGWEYTFNITLPSDESNLAMKFSDWTSGSSTMAVANNIRISSAQADNGGAPITVTAVNTYTMPDLNMTVDLDPMTAGIQVQVTVEVKIPVGTTNGSYTTSYGVRSQ